MAFACPRVCSVLSSIWFFFLRFKISQRFSFFFPLSFCNCLWRHWHFFFLSLFHCPTLPLNAHVYLGWYQGERMRDDQRGWFPGNYTVEIASSHVRARNLRQRYRLLALSGNFIEEQARKDKEENKRKNKKISIILNEWMKHVADIGCDINSCKSSFTSLNFCLFFFIRRAFNHMHFSFFIEFIFVYPSVKRSCHFCLQEKIISLKYCFTCVCK